MSMRIRVLLRAIVVFAMAAASPVAFCATVTWDGGGPDDWWSTPANWSTNSLPTASDAVVITTASGAVWLDLNATVSSITVQTGATLRVEPGWVITVNNSSTVASGGNLYIPGGTYSGNGALAVSGNLLIESGTINGSGALSINSSGQMTITSNPSAAVISRAITNAGTITFSSSSTTGATFNGATITNTGIIQIDNNHAISPGAGSPILNNNTGGLITMNGGSVGAAINFTVNNASGATIQVQSGIFSLNGGGTVSGAYSISALHTLRLGAGTFTMSGNPTVSGGGELRISGATLDVGTGVDVTCPKVFLVAGTITGAGAFRVSGGFQWFGGTIAGSGPRVLNSTSVPSFGCSFGDDCLLDGAALQLQASATFSDSGGAIAFSNGASLTIDPGKTLEITSDGSFPSGGGGASFIVNNGTIWKSGAGMSTIGVPVTLSGTSTVDIDNGTVQFGDDVSVASGATIDIASGTTLDVTGGMFQLNGSASMLGSGDFKVSSGMLRVFALNTIPNLELQGGIIDGAGDLHVSGNFSWLGGTIVGGGARVLDSTSTPAISCSAGHCNLDGTTATLQMNASGTFNATTNSLVFLNSASLVIASGKTLDITTDGTIVGVGTITNNGTITKSGGTGIRSIGTVLHNNGSVIVTSGGLSLLGNGTHSGSFTVTAPGSMLFDAGTHTIAGGISGTGIMGISGGTVTLNSAGNVGSLEMSGGTLNGSGTLTLANGGTWSDGTMGGSGTTAVAAGKTLTVFGFSTLDGRTLGLGTGAMLDLTSQMLDVPSATNVTGSGTVRVNGGTLRVLSGVTQTIPNLTLTTGVIDGAGTLNVSGNFTWSGGTITGSGARLLNSTSVPAITCSLGDCLLDGGTLRLQAWGTYSASSNSLVLSNGASLILDPGQVLYVSNDGDFVNGGGAASSITIGGFGPPGVNGCIEKTTTAGISIIDVPVTMAGSFKTVTGTLQAGAGVTVAGNAIVHADPGTIVEVTGGVFLVNSSSLSFPASGDFKVSAGTLRVPTGVTITIPKLTLQGSGVIDGGGTVILAGTSTWAGGTMGSATAPGGITRIDSGNTLNVTAAGPSSLTQSRIVRNNGTLNLPNSGSINLSGSATIENNGTMGKNAGAGTTTIFPRVENNNGGTVSVAAGTIALSGGGIAGGAYAISSGATLTLVGGTFDVAGTATVTGAGTLSVAGGTLDSGAGADVTIPNLALSSGTITGPGAVRVSGDFSWLAGTIAGSGDRVLNGTSTPAIGCSAGNCLLSGASLQVQATGTYSASSNALVLSNGASLILDPGKTLNVTNDGAFSDGGGTASSVINNGTIAKTTTSGTSTIGVPVTMSGSLDVDTGTLQLAAGATVNAGAVIDYAAGTLLEVTGGLFLFNSGPVSFPGSGTFNVSAGTLRVPASITVTIPGLTLQGSSVVDGAGTLILSGTSQWHGGTMGSATAPGGITQIDSGATLSITSVSPKSLTQARQLVNNGTVNYGAVPPNHLTMSGNSEIANNASLNLDSTITLSGSAVIENNGTITKTAVAVNAVEPALNNNAGATLNVNGGTLLFYGGGIAAGAYAISSGATLTLAGGTFDVTNTSTVTGAGTFSIDGATLDAGPGVDITWSNVTLSAGTIAGAGTVRVSGNFTWSGGTIAGSGARVLNSTSVPAISCSAANCLLDGATLQLQATGTYSASSNALVLSNGASLIVDPGKTLNITNDGAFQDGGGIASSVINNGTIAKTTTFGTSTIGVPVTMAGLLDVDTGTLQLAAGMTVNTGAVIDYAAGTLLEVTGGVFLCNSGTVSFPGSGTFNVSGGTLRVPASITVTIPGVTLQGSSVVDGAGTLILSGTSQWHGGTMGSATAPGGITQIDSGATLSVNSVSPKTLTQTRQLLNNGTVNYGAVPPNHLTMSGNSEIANNGLLNLDSTITLSGSAVIENNGTITKTAAVVNAIEPALDNNAGATLNVNGGILGLYGGGTQRGAFTIASGAKLILGGGTFTMLGSPTVSGPGIFEIDGSVDVGNGPGGGADVFTVGAPFDLFGTVNLKDATLQASSTVSVSGTIEHYGGAISGSGTMTINSGGVLNSHGTDSASAIAIDTTVSTGGELDVIGNVFQHGLSGNITVTNDGTIDFQGDGGLSSFSGAPQLVNTGTLEKSAGSGTTGIDVPVDSNAGSTVQAASGTLAFNQGGNFTNVTISGAGTVALPATAAVSGTTTLTGKLRLTGNAALSGTLNAAGTLLLGEGVNVTWPNVNLSATGSKIDGDGALNVSGSFTWSGGTVTGSGARVLQSSSVPTISCTAGNCLLDGAKLQLQASGEYSASSFALMLSNGAELNIAAGKTLSITGSSDLLNGGGSSIINDGTIRKASAGTSSIDVPVTLSGTLDIDTGTLQVAGGAIVNTGAAIDLAAGTTLEVTAGVCLFNSGSVSTSPNGDFKVSGGTLRVATGTVTLPNVTLQGSGVIDGGGTLVLSGTSTWAGGTMGSVSAPGGITRIDDGKTLDITNDGSQTLTHGRELLNNGTVNYDGSSTLTLSGAGKITNNVSFNLTADGDVNVSGSGTIVNNGTLTKSAGTGTSKLFPTLNNAGTVSATTGTLALAGGGTHTGSFSATTEGTLSFPSGTHSMSGGSIGGTGTLAISGATVTVNSPFTIGALSISAGTATLDANGSVDALDLTGGTLDGNGTLTLTNGGTWSAGTMSGSGTTIIPDMKTLVISSPVTLDRTLQNDGILTVNGDITGAGTIDNRKILNAGNVNIGVAVNNSGDLATSGSLSLALGGTHTGTFAITAPGNLSFSAGTHIVSGGSIGGTGTLTFSGATATVDVPVTIGKLFVTAGTATLNATANADAFEMTGGTLDGSGTLTLTNGGTWSSGTMAGSGTTAVPSDETLNISGAVTLSSRTLQNDGTLNVSGDVAGSGTIANNNRLDATGNSTIGVALNNSGEIEATALLSLAGDGTHSGSGTFAATAPGSIAFPSGTHTMSDGTSMTGTGTFAFDGAAVTVSGPFTIGDLSVTAGTVTFDANGSIASLNMTGGTLDGSGTLTLTNGGTWSSGTMAGSGTTAVPANATLGLSGAVTLNGRTLQNAGTASVSGDITGSGTIANNGTLNAVGNSTIGAALDNSGQIAAGALLSLGGNGTHTGTFTATAPGMIDFSGGTQTISGTLAGTEKVRFSGAAATVSGTWSGMPIEVAGGSVAFNSNGTIPALTLSGGTLAGSGDVTVSGPSTWSGGTIAGSGALTFDTGATVTMPGTNAVTLSRPLLNKGTIDFTAVSNGMLIAGVAVTNDGTFDIQSSQGIAATAGTPPFVNRGTLKKSSGPGVMQFAPPLSNSGMVQVESGTLHVSGNYAQSDGTTTILAGATLQTEMLSLDGGSLTGNGSVAGTVANHATVSPGASPGTLTIDGDYVQSPDGALAIELAGTAPGTQYDRLLVSGSVTLDGTLDVTALAPTPGNAFQIITFGSRLDNSTFAVMNGLNVSGTALVPTFSATGLQLIASQLPVADVAIGVTGPVSTIAGTKVIYTVTVSNGGPDTATGVAVTATPSPGLTFSGNSGACVGSFPCTLGMLGAGQSATIHTAWDIAPSATGTVQLTVNASSAADANPSNDSASASTIIGSCPIITIVAPSEMISGETATATATPFDGATYSWTIDSGTIDSGDGTPVIAFTAGESGTARLDVNVTGGGCTLGATFDVTVKPPPLTCVGTAAPAAPADDTITADAVVTFAWNEVDGASGYRVWLQQDGAPARYLGTTLGTSRTRIIPPGTYRWYVETLFDGCASHESERRILTILPGQDCANREAPQLSAPANGGAVASAAVAFSWNAVAQALEYELWLAPLGGVPTLIRTTSDTSYTAVVPPGRLEWYVRGVFGGCASTESAHQVFTCTRPPECTSQRPLLIAPLEGERLTSPASFEWTSVSGATSYELYVDGVLAATTTSPHASGLSVPLGERRWQVRARLGEGCGAVDSAGSRLVVIPSPASCAPLDAPVISAPAQISSGTAGRIQWTFVAGATAYVVEVSGDPRFARGSTSSSTVTARQLPFTFTNQGSTPMARYVRVHAVDTKCVQPGTGAFSPVAVLSVLPSTGSEGVALLSDPTDVPYTLSIAADRAGQSFTATPTVPWLSVTPASGIVPPGGQTLHAVAHTAGLPPGTSTGSVEIATTTTSSGAVTALATSRPVKLPVSLHNIPGVVTAPKNTPPPDALTIPAVASVKNVIVRYDSDISVTNTSAQVMEYEIDFVPTGPAGMSEGQKTKVSIESGATMAMNDIVATWFGGRSSTGTLEIRPLTETDTSMSSAPVGGLANRTTFASSRTFSTTAAGGTYGQYIPAVPYANFVSIGQTLSLQHIAQSDEYRTNLGLVEGSGEKVSLEVRIFDAAGTKRASFNVDLNGGERAQLDALLAGRGVPLDDGRIEVEVTSGAGKVTAYASVVDNSTNDPQLVPPVTLDHAGHSKWVVPGVADLVSGSGTWQTDVRIFNAGTEPVALTLAYYSMSGGPAVTRTIELAAGEVRQLDRVLSFFAVSGDAGALHVSSAAPAQVVVTARTYNQTEGGVYGQFIVAVTPDEAVSVGSRPLQILQMEESEHYRSNIGFAEVSGNPVTLEVVIFRPNSEDPFVLEVKLEPNQFLQLNSLLASADVREMYNARISVRAVSGEGRALAYGSLIDQKTGDPTFIPGQ
ncbi:MAG TPA: hypothetical protein VE974_02725 [Thermoanaerobaculia bacterium]|nr:hypothetical protein [Thermoanaerobaculia bacterium]